MARQVVIHLEQTKKVFIIFMEIVELNLFSEYDVSIKRYRVFPQLPLCPIHILINLIRQHVLTNLFDDQLPSQPILIIISNKVQMF